MKPTILLLLRVVAALPAVFVVLLFDSMSKEPYGFPLYFVTACAGLALAQVFWWRRDATDRDKLSESALGGAAACGCGGTAVVAIVVVIWLIAIGH